jgi:hypothetical protein
VSGDLEAKFGNLFMIVQPKNNFFFLNNGRGMLARLLFSLFISIYIANLITFLFNKYKNKLINNYFCRLIDIIFIKKFILNYSKIIILYLIIFRGG